MSYELDTTEAQWTEARKLIEDNLSNVWATKKGGIFRLDRSRIKFISVPCQIFQKDSIDFDVSDMTEDENGQF